MMDNIGKKKKQEGIPSWSAVKTVFARTFRFLRLFSPLTIISG